MTRCVALLRGINVGGSRKLAMAELRRVFESLGFADVTTYIQSGNVLFRTDHHVSASDLATAVAERAGFGVDVIVRTAAELARVVGENPFPTAEPKALHVGFMARRPEPDALASLDLDRFTPEAAEVRATEIYFHLPKGMGRAKLPAYLDGHLKVPITVRNWNTTTKLLELIR